MVFLKSKWPGWKIKFLINGSIYLQRMNDVLEASVEKSPEHVIKSEN
jgi:hypothetical protein